MVRKFPNGCLRCHRRAAASRISGLCQECHEIAEGLRSHRSRFVACSLAPLCSRKFADWHSMSEHVRMKHYGEK